MEYQDPYQCVLEIRGGKNRDELQRILSPLLVGIDPAFELVSLSKQNNFIQEYQGCGKTANDSHFYELDEGEYIESPAIAILLFLDENSPSLTPQEATEALLSDSWEFHHKIELSKLQKGTPKTIAKQDYYTLGQDLPLWSVGSIHYGNEHLRFNIFTRRFAAMVEFYRVLTGKEGECTRSGFCMFPIYSQPGLDIQLALKRSERIIPFALKSAAMRFRIRNVKELKSVTSSKILQMNDGVYCVLDPDGNLVVLEQIGNETKTSPRARLTLEDNRSIADSFDSGRYSTSDQGESNEFNSTYQQMVETIYEYPARNLSDEVADNKNEIRAGRDVPPKPTPRQKGLSNTPESPRARPTPTKRKMNKNNDPTIKVDAKLSSEHYEQKNVNELVPYSEQYEHENVPEPVISVRDRAKAINLKLSQSSQQTGDSLKGPNVKCNMTSAKQLQQNAKESEVSVSQESWQHASPTYLETAPRCEGSLINEPNTDSYKTQQENPFGRSKSLTTVPVELTVSKLKSTILENDENERINQRMARGRTVSSGAVLTNYHNGSDRSANNQRIPTETMNKLLKTLPTRLEGQSGTKTHLRLDQRIRRVLNSNSNPQKESTVPKTEGLGARF